MATVGSGGGGNSAVGGEVRAQTVLETYQAKNRIKKTNRTNIIATN